MSRLTAEQRRESVLTAALTEFSAAGFAGTSTEAIAQRAGISQPYLFRLFTTKKDLFIATLTRAFERIEAAMTEAAEGQSGENALCAMGEAYLVLLTDRDLLLTQLHAYAASDDADVRAAAQRAFGRLWRTVEALSGLSGLRIKEFFAMGMLLNVAAALELADLDETWAELCSGGEGHERLCTHTHHDDTLTDVKRTALRRAAAARST
jgi:AcrR family transcriptional regulator